MLSRVKAAKAAKSTELSTISVNRIIGLLRPQIRDESLLAAIPEVACMPRQNIRPGGRVRVQRGVFEGVEGTIISYRSATRLLIAVELDCRGVSLEIDDRMVETLDT